MNTFQLIEVLLGRWKLIVATTLLMTIVGFVGSVLLPKKYTSTATVIVDMRAGDALGNDAAARAQNAAQAAVATQIDLIGSERVARRVATLLKLDTNAALLEQWRMDTEGTGDQANYIAKILLARLNVTAPNRDSNVISISYTSPDPKTATTLVNAFARTSIETNLELKTEPARQFATWFDERTQVLRKDVEAAQEKLIAYQRKKGLVSGGGSSQIDIENAKLSQLAEQLVKIQAARSESNSRQTLARGDARTSPDVLNNSVIAGLRTSVTTSEATIKLLTAQYGEQHPSVMTARAQLSAFKGQLESEMQAVARSVTTSNTVNEQRENEARAALDAQKERVLALMNGPNEVTAMQRDVDSAQRALDAARTRQAQTSLESQVQQASVYLLSPAAEPNSASRPKVAVYTACAAAVGLLLSLALALGMEARTPLIRSAEDLALVADLPVLATLPRTVLRVGPPSARRLSNRIVPS